MPFCHLQIKALRRAFPANWITTQTTPAELKTIGDHIKQRRIELHLLQRDVAERIGVHRESVKNWERGVLSPMIIHLPKIIEFLGYNPEAEPGNLPQWIVHIRRQLGLTQEALAKALAIDPVTLWRWEKGNIAPPDTKLRELEALLNHARIIPQ